MPSIEEVAIQSKVFMMVNTTYSIMLPETLNLKSYESKVNLKIDSIKKEINLMPHQSGTFSLSLVLESNTGLQLTKDITVQVNEMIVVKPTAASDPEPKKQTVPVEPLVEKVAPPLPAFKGVSIVKKEVIEKFNSTRLVDFKV